MKVVLFCGGLGTRLRDYSETIPKPLIPIGDRPILWQVMRYYAHFGHKEFILCLGYKADSIRQYFLKYQEAAPSELAMSAGREKTPFGSNIHDWKITFVDTGIDRNIGMRLKAVQSQLEGDEMFLANYSDGVSDLPLPAMVHNFRQQSAVATFVAVPPAQSFHLVALEDSGRVRDIRHVKDIGMRMNGGFFVFRREIFDWIEAGEDLVEGPFQRLAAAGKLLAYPYDGFWACMDTFKDKQRLEDVYSHHEVPWEVWKTRTLFPRSNVE